MRIGFTHVLASINALTVSAIKGPLKGRITTAIDMLLVTLADEGVCGEARV